MLNNLLHHGADLNVYFLLNRMAFANGVFVRLDRFNHLANLDLACALLRYTNSFNVVVLFNGWNHFADANHLLAFLRNADDFLILVWFNNRNHFADVYGSNAVLWPILSHLANVRLNSHLCFMANVVNFLGNNVRNPNAAGCWLRCAA